MPTMLKEIGPRSADDGSATNYQTNDLNQYTSIGGAKSDL